jgi:formate dehydrogenase iron-sulfur subunit
LPDRVAVGLELACIKAARMGALVRYQGRYDASRGQRVEDQVARLSRRAKISDRVGGTHVMYVHAHATSRSFQRPRARAAHQPAGQRWKGVTKPLVIAGIALTALALFHYLMVGLNETTDEDRNWPSAN